ncbi:MAG: hypothetical protein JNM88_19175 [Chitinophagaceae bacterium]|nr:hypothetical protein [Chitinophagaceae bacterium]
MRKGFIIFIFLGTGITSLSQPDLTFMPNGIQVTPDNVHVGISIALSMKVKNTGTATAPLSTTRIYISPTTDYNDGVPLADISLQALPAQASDTTIKFNHPIPYTINTSGTYYFFVELNADLVFSEADESNNVVMSGGVYINAAPWAAQNIPYPIIFVHGYMGANTTWDTFIDSLQKKYGWSYGGNMDFCLNYDGDLTTSDLNTDYHDFYGEPGHTINQNPCDFYTVNFKVNPNGLPPYDNSYQSNQAGIVKQGLAISDAINHVLAITGKNKVILVGHSMGGLASREYIQNRSIWKEPYVDHHVAKLLTLGTPHGGSNFIDPNGNIFPAFDGRSESIRDLRTGYTYSYFWPFGAPDPNNDAPGAYLFGGVEDLDYMRDQYLFKFHNADVNCDGQASGEPVVGINQKAIATDLSYSCIVGTGDLLGGDGVVTTYSADLNNFRPVNATVFTLPKTSGLTTIWHLELTKQYSGTMQGMDEPNESYNNHPYQVSSGNLYYGNVTYQCVTCPAKDYDYYKTTVSASGSLSIEVFSITTPVFTLEVKNSAGNTIYSLSSNGKSYINGSVFVSPGTYYIVMSGVPTSDSYKYPYSFKFTFSAGSTSCTGTTNLTATSGSFNDGSGAGNYSNNSDCRWKIQPSGATSITLNFMSFDVADPGDTLYVYNGGTTSSPLLGAFTGNAIPPSITSSGGVLLVRFLTDGVNTAGGWAASYTAVTVPVYCNGQTNLTAPTGSFSDGSGVTNYGNNSYCSWLINPPGAFSVTLSFTGFVTEPVYDLVNVYDGNDNNALLLGSYSGNSLPPVLTSTGGQLFVEFLSNDSITASGWNASYTAYIPYSSNGITGYEYWFDNDYLNNVSAPVMPQTVFELNTNIPTNSLNYGLHILNTRFQSNNENWSGVLSTFFYKPVIITAGTPQYEYWFDTDYASKTSINTAAANSLLLMSDLPVNTLSGGLHSFNIRFRPDGKTWSSTVSSFFYKPNIVSSGNAQYEYWFDNNYSNRFSINITGTMNFILLDSILTNSVPNGLHTLHYRFRPDGKTWSSITSSFFYKNNSTLTGINNLAQYIYWFDNNWQNPQTITITGIQNLNWTLNTNVDSLTNGPHVLSKAFKDDKGQWSSIISSSFTKEPATIPGCLAENRQFVAGIIAGGSVLCQWQLDSGTGFQDITDNTFYAGSANDTLELSNVPTSWYGYKFRCRVTNGAIVLYGPVYILKFSSTWTGTIDNAWENPANWSCNNIPDGNTDVYINTGLSRYPQVNSIAATCRSLNLQPGTTFEVRPGFKIDITGKN